MANLSKNIAALAASAALLGAEAGAQVRHGEGPRDPRDSHFGDRNFRGGLDFTTNRGDNIILIRDAASLQSAVSAAYGGYGFPDQEARDQRKADALQAIENLSRNNYVFAIDEYDRPVAFRLSGRISNRLNDGEYLHLNAERIDDPAQVYDLARQHYVDIIALRDLTRRAPDELNRGYFGVLVAQSARDASAFAFNSSRGEGLIYSPRATGNPSATLDNYLAFHQRMMTAMSDRLLGLPAGPGMIEQEGGAGSAPLVDVPFTGQAAQMPDFSNLSLEQKVGMALDLYNQINAAESAADALRKAFRDAPIQFQLPNVTQKVTMTLAESEADFLIRMEPFLREVDMNPALPGQQAMSSDQVKELILRGLRLRAANDFGPFFDNQEGAVWNEAQQAALNACAEREDYFYPDASLGLFDANIPELRDNSPYDIARRDFMILTMDGQVMQGLGEAIAAQDSNREIEEQIAQQQARLEELRETTQSLTQMQEQRTQTYKNIEAALQAVLSNRELRDDLFRKELRSFLVGDTSEGSQVTKTKEDLLGFLRGFAAANPELPENSPARPILVDVVRYDALNTSINSINEVIQRLNGNNRSR